MVAAEMFQQALGMPAGARGVGRQFRPVAGDVGRVGRLKSGPELRQADLLTYLPLPIPRVAVQFTLQLQAQPQKFLAGQIEPIAPRPGNRLEQEVLEEPALVGAAEADAPGDAAAGIPRQTEGTVPGAKRLVIQYYHAHFSTSIRPSITGPLAR